MRISSRGSLGVLGFSGLWLGLIVAVACSHTTQPGDNAADWSGGNANLAGVGASTAAGSSAGGGSAPLATGGVGSGATAPSSGGAGAVLGSSGAANGGSAGSAASGGASAQSGGGAAGLAAGGATAGAGGSGACGPGGPAPAADGSNFPFPQRRFSSSCFYPPTCADADVAKGWENYKARMIVDGGDGTLRVQRPEFDNDTVSEGIAYGMLFAAYMNDKTIFDKIWGYAQKHFDGNGLMNWKISADGGSVNADSATDADEDMAFALVMADKQWGGYTETAKDFIGRVASKDFTGDGTVRGGDNYGDVNPSYLAPAFYRVFQSYTGDSRWSTIIEKSYAILEGAANADTGLVPDWTNGRGNNYSYDAARTPYRIALDACWNGEPRAKAYAEKVGKFFAGIGVDNIRDGYSLDGNLLGEHKNATFIGPAGVAGMVANEAQLVTDAYKQVSTDLQEGTENYYNMSWALFSAMMMTGNFVNLAASP